MDRQRRIELLRMAEQLGKAEFTYQSETYAAQSFGASTQYVVASHPPRVVFPSIESSDITMLQSLCSLMNKAVKPELAKLAEVHEQGALEIVDK